MNRRACAVAAILLALPVAMHAASASVASAATAAATCDTKSTATYADPSGDARDAPDLAEIIVTPCGAALRFEITLAQPTDLGRYGWILVGINTDSNRMTGGVGFGADYLLIANGLQTTIGRWHNGRFDFSFSHADLNATLTLTELAFTLDASELHAHRFRFAVASLRETADLAPDSGTFTYPTPKPSGPEPGAGGRAPQKRPNPFARRRSPKASPAR